MGDSKRRELSFTEGMLLQGRSMHLADFTQVLPRVSLGQAYVESEASQQVCLLPIFLSGLFFRSLCRS